jgi:hypothetical protein
MARTKLSTGILARDRSSFNAHIDIANFSAFDQTMKVEVFDWGVDNCGTSPHRSRSAPQGVSLSLLTVFVPFSHSSLSQLLNPHTRSDSTCHRWLAAAVSGQLVELAA